MIEHNEWREAGGALQRPFYSAIGRILDGDYSVQCPGCGTPILRFYFHIFDPDAQTGTMWVWCPTCRVMSHLPRVRPTKGRFSDPYRDLDLDAFAELELAEGEPFISRLDRLWDAGVIGLPPTP